MCETFAEAILSVALLVGLFGVFRGARGVYSVEDGRFRWFEMLVF